MNSDVTRLPPTPPLATADSLVTMNQLHFKLFYTLSLIQNTLSVETQFRLAYEIQSRMI